MTYQLAFFLKGKRKRFKKKKKKIIGLLEISSSNQIKTRELLFLLLSFSQLKYERDSLVYFSGTKREL